MCFLPKVSIDARSLNRYDSWTFECHFDVLKCVREPGLGSYEAVLFDSFAWHVRERHAKSTTSSLHSCWIWQMSFKSTMTWLPLHINFKRAIVTASDARHEVGQFFWCPTGYGDLRQLPQVFSFALLNFRIEGICLFTWIADAATFRYWVYAHWSSNSLRSFHHWESLYGKFWTNLQQPGGWEKGR